MSGSHFIVYGARYGAKSFFEGISDPTFFMSINRILDEGFYREYFDPRLKKTFSFLGLLEFVTDHEGLDVADWVPFMKALHAQDNGTDAKVLYDRMTKLDLRLIPPLGSQSHATRLLPLKDLQFAEAGNPHGNRDVITVRSQGDGGTSAAYLAARLKKAERDDLLQEIGPDKRFKSARAAAIEAGIIIPFPSLQLKDPLPTAQKLLAKKGKEWCLQLLEELSSLVFED